MRKFNLLLTAALTTGLMFSGLSAMDGKKPVDATPENVLTFVETLLLREDHKELFLPKFNKQVSGMSNEFKTLLASAISSIALSDDFVSTWKKFKKCYNSSDDVRYEVKPRATIPYSYIYNFWNIEKSKGGVLAILSKGHPTRGSFLEENKGKED